MQAGLPDLTAIQQLFPGLRLLALHGSRARGDAHDGSDWDFAYLADAELDELELRAELGRTLGTDAVDLVDLERAGGLVRYRVARDGVLLFERESGTFERFFLAAVRFWLDASRAIREGYAGALDSLG